MLRCFDFPTVPFFSFVNPLPPHHFNSEYVTLMQISVLSHVLLQCIDSLHACLLLKEKKQLHLFPFQPLALGRNPSVLTVGENSRYLSPQGGFYVEISDEGCHSAPRPSRSKIFVEKFVHMMTSLLNKRQYIIKG